MSDKTSADSAATRLNQVLARIARACASAGRSPSEITLIAVSKTHQASDIVDLANAGQTDFAENYLQEAREKIPSVARPQLNWHFIGHVQSNKCSEIARLFDWVHSVDRYKTASLLSMAAVHAGKVLDVMLQVNVSEATGKSGTTKDDLPDLLKRTADLAGVRVRGLMTVPEPSQDPATQREPFAELHRLLLDARRAGFELDCLSMGMSADLEAAVLEAQPMSGSAPHCSVHATIRKRGDFRDYSRTNRLHRWRQHGRGTACRVMPIRSRSRLHRGRRTRCPST
jgi:PLP dependent protein